MVSPTPHPRHRPLSAEGINRLGFSQNGPETFKQNHRESKGRRGDGEKREKARGTEHRNGHNGGRVSFVKGHQGPGCFQCPPG